MGYGDEIVLADGNFPAESHSTICVRADGLMIPEILTGILNLMPLDSYVEQPVVLMMHGEETVKPAIWKEYEEIITKEYAAYNPNLLDRFTFYERAKKAYAIVATSESQLYANIILRKGVIA